jgi:hypothetical protein
MLPAASWAGQETAGYLLDLPPGGRAIGMGSAQGAVAEDPDAGYWNPAALAFVEPKHAVAVTYSRLKGIEDFPFVYAAYSASIPELSGTIAVSFAYFDLGEREDQTTGESYRPDEMAPAVAYGGRLSDELAVGIGVKMYRINYSSPDAPPDLDFTATTVLFDGGILWRGKDSRVLVGGAVQNLGPDLEFGSNGQSEPPARNLKLSLGARLVDLEYARLVVAGDLNTLLVGENNAPRLMVGGEMQVGPYAALRIGLRYDGWFIEDNDFTENQQQYATTLGFGVRMKGIAIDYANAPWSVLSSRNSHHISVGARF